MKSTTSCWKADGISLRIISQQVIAVRLLKKRKIIGIKTKNRF